MADKIAIIGGAPTVNLGVRSWTTDIAIPELASWTTLDDSAFSIVNGRIVAVAPRAGTGLQKSTDSLGPVRETRGGLPVGKFTNNELNYLHSPSLVNGASFTMAAIVYIDAYTGSARDLMGLFETGNSVRVWRSGGRYEVRSGSTTLLAGSRAYTQSGWQMIIWSQHNGEAALRTQSIGQEAVTQRVANAVSAGANCQAVIGADEIANGQVGASPLASRSWQDCVAEFMVWRGVDILSTDLANERAALVAYFNEIYGAAA